MYMFFCFFKLFATVGKGLLGILCVCVLTCMCTQACTHACMHACKDLPF